MKTYEIKWMDGETDLFKAARIGFGDGSVISFWGHNSEMLLAINSRSIFWVKLVEEK